VALGDRLEHLATPIRYVMEGERIEGERDVAAVPFTPFECLLLAPNAPRDDPSPRGRRVIKRPTLLYEPYDLLDEDPDLTPDVELDIEAEGLPERWQGRWQVEGEPLPMGRPGELLGYQAFLKRVED
jgi:hypothetical protein